MLTLINRRNLGAKVARATALCLLALAASLFQAREARAQWTTSGANTTTTNNVGIGTAAPVTQLELKVPSGDVITRFSNAGGESGALDLRYKVESTLHRMGLTDANGQWMFYTQFAPSNVNSLGFFPGRVGVGTDAPARALSIESPTAPAIGLNAAGAERGTFGVVTHVGNWFSGTVANDTALRSQTSDLWIGTYSGSKPIRFMTNDAQRLIIDGAGNVGVGAAAPAVKLAVSGNGQNVYATDAWVENNMHIQGNEVISQGGGRGRMRLGTAWGYVGLYAETSSAGAVNDLVLGAGSGTVRVGPGGSIPQSFVVPNGRIGVGTATPGAALDVNGDIRVSGNINAKYQDVAEWVPSTQKLAAGTVVILDTGRDNHVLASKGSYDTRVAGVISAQPGLSLGEAGEGKVLVATTGRVKVRVDATRAPIRIGDLIVTSDVEGVAMKSVPVELGGVAIHRPGTLIGKALESLEKGAGEILVLLSLQ